MRAASAASHGFPNTADPINTTVSAPITTRFGYRDATAVAFSIASRATYAVETRSAVAFHQRPPARPRRCSRRAQAVRASGEADASTRGSGG